MTTFIAKYVERKFKGNVMGIELVIVGNPIRNRERKGIIDIDFYAIWNLKRRVYKMSLPDCVAYAKLEASGYFDAVNQPVYHCCECLEAIELGDKFYEIESKEYCRECGEEYVKDNLIKEAR